MHVTNNKPAFKNLGETITVMHLSMLSRWGGGRPGIGRGFDVTSLPMVGTFDHSLSSFDQQ